MYALSMDLSEIEFGEIECGRNLNQALEDRGRLARETERAVSRGLLHALKDTLSYASRLADPEDQEWLFYRKQADEAITAAEVQP